MKRTLLGLVLCLGLLTACGGAPQEHSGSMTTDGQEALQQEAGELAAVRESIAEAGAAAGILYLGYYEGSPLEETFYALPEVQGQLEGYSFVREIPQERLVQNPGAEVYCLIPARSEATVRVTAWDMETDTEGAVLYEGDGAPLLLQGNISDIMPNLAVTIGDSTGTIVEQYQPFISLRDGRVNLPDGVKLLDLTLYNVVFGEETENLSNA